MKKKFSNHSLFLPMIVTMTVPLTVFSQNRANDAAVSSQAVINQPNAPKAASEAMPPSQAAPAPQPPPSPNTNQRILDPRLDLNRPKDSQLSIAVAQTISCGEVSVLLPVGTYTQKLIIEGPGNASAIKETHLEPQQKGLGFIRYASDVPLKINGVERSGGLDVPVRKEDNLPIRIWYKKMTEPDDLTKMFSFILPPVALIAGVGAWSSGNVLLPDSPPDFTEARDYYLKPIEPKTNPSEIPQPSHVRPLRDPYASGSNQIRSK